MQLQFQDPVVEHLQKSFAVVSWKPPSQLSGTSPRRVAWRYCIEWRGENETEEFSKRLDDITTTIFFVPLSLDNETHLVRVHAKGILLHGDVTSTAACSGRVTIDPGVSTSPWLPVSNASDRLYIAVADALLLLSTPTFDSEVLDSSERDVEFIGCGGAKQFSFSVSRVRYHRSSNDHHQTFYFISVDYPGGRVGGKLQLSDIKQWAESDDSTVVISGCETRVRHVFSLMTSLFESEPPKTKNILCILFGGERPDMVQSPLPIVRGSSLMLFVGCTTNKQSPYAAGAHLIVETDSGGQPRLEVSWGLPERDIGGGWDMHLTLLKLFASTRRMSILDATKALSPSVSSLSYSDNDGCFLNVALKGRHLHFRPRVLFSVGGVYALGSLLQQSPSLVIATVRAADLVHRVIEGAVKLVVIVTTTFGASEIACDLKFTQEFQESANAELVKAWFATPATTFLNSSILVECLSSTYGGESAENSTSTELLLGLEYAAEAVKSAVPNSASLFARVANAAAKAVNTPPITLQPLQRYASQLLPVLAEYFCKGSIIRLQKQASTFCLRLSSVFTCLDDAQYLNKVRSLVSVLCPDAPSATNQWSLLVSESVILGTIVRHLGESFCPRGVEIPLCSQIPFEQFYMAMIPLLQPRGGAPREIVLDAAALWTVSLVHQLRLFHMTTSYIVVCGAPGSGCTSLTKLIESVLQETVSRQRVLVRCIGDRFDDLKEVLRLGCSVHVLVVGEVADVVDTARHAEELNGYVVIPLRQPIWYVTTKLDEHIADAGEVRNLDPEEIVRKLHEVVEKKCQLRCPGWVHVSRKVALATAPQVRLQGITPGVAQCLVTETRRLVKTIVGH